MRSGVLSCMLDGLWLGSGLDFYELRAFGKMGAENTERLLLALPPSSCFAVVIFHMRTLCLVFKNTCPSFVPTWACKTSTASTSASKSFLQAIKGKDMTGPCPFIFGWFGAFGSYMSRREFRATGPKLGPNSYPCQHTLQRHTLIALSNNAFNITLQDQ